PRRALYECTKSSLEEKLLVSVFQSVSSRTAGFSVVDFGETGPETNFFLTALMFIGGASASVAGGIKVTTVAVVVLGLVSALRGRGHTSAFGREVPGVQVRNAMVIGAVSLGFLFLTIFLLMSVEHGVRFIDLVFESVSAFGTAGLSAGITENLSSCGRLLLIITMFAGRLGPFAIGLALAHTESSDLYRFAQESVAIG
ncbi:MAG: potassium transporter TrkG, partial [Anaerolineae bacterium]